MLKHATVRVAAIVLLIVTTMPVLTAESGARILSVIIYVDETSTKPSGFVRLAADVVASEGAVLIYDWQITAGSLAGITGPRAVWIAPSTPGTETISLRVEDEDGQEVSDSISIPVIGN